MTRQFSNRNDGSCVEMMVKITYWEFYNEGQISGSDDEKVLLQGYEAKTGGYDVVRAEYSSSIDLFRCNNCDDTCVQYYRIIIPTFC